jgi:hypothetical protein
MQTQRTNPHYKLPQPKPPTATPLVAVVPASPVPTPPKGDIIYGARAIAKFLFDDDSNKARRRVFNLWHYYSQRQKRAGFFKLKGALCLSKTQWLAYHGLGV